MTQARKISLSTNEKLAQCDGTNKIVITAHYGNDISFQIWDNSEREEIILWDSINVSGLKDKSNDKIIAHIRATYFQQ